MNRAGPLGALQCRRCGGALIFHRCPELGRDSRTFQPRVDPAWVQAPWEGAGTRGEGTSLVEAVLEAVRVVGWRCPHMQGMVPFLLSAVRGPNLGDRGDDLAVTQRHRETLVGLRRLT